MNNAVECAIARMWEGYSEPLSLADIAKSAILSRFHFSRVFRAATGVSPGRFLSAVRIYEAKRMLVSTSLSVTDISLAVGYNSLGSFTNRFTASVGVPPTRFRRMRDSGAPEAAGPGVVSSPPYGTVAGLLDLPPRYSAARVYVGAFRTPIVECLPLSSAIIEAEPDRAAGYRLPGVPSGEWFIRAIAVADTADPEPWTTRSLLVGGHGSVKVTAGAVTETNITMHPKRPTDPPILLAVPGLEPADLAGPADPKPAADQASRLVAAQVPSRR
jgi:AraC family transcriptional regulator